jgi:acetyl/propionyl-CoA carboxylase alpha subunit
MSKFYCIAHSTQLADSDSGDLLRKASKVAQVSFVPVYTDAFDFTDVPSLQRGDMLYRIDTGVVAGVIERLLIRADTVTMYRNNEYAMRPLGTFAGSIVLAANGLPIVPTVYDLPTERTQLDRAVGKLGGLPIIVKEMGGTHGVGVMKFESMESLYSVVDVLRVKGGNYVLRKYVDYTKHVRTIVVDDSVVAAIQYERVAKDFRSNVGGDIKVNPVLCDEVQTQIAVDAVKAKGVYIGGVDLLVDTNGDNYIAEVNFPCFFPRAQHATGTDIAGAILSSLQGRL